MAVPSTDTDELASFGYKQELNGRGATPSVKRLCARETAPVQAGTPGMSCTRPRSRSSCKTVAPPVARSL